MRSALLVIDVQRGLFDPEPRPFEADLVIDRVNRLSDRARRSGVPVVFIQHEYRSGTLEYGSDSWQLARRLVVHEEDTRVRKTTPDAFLRTNLGLLLERWATEQVVICGFASEFCVDTTVRRAAALGYRVILVADAHTTHDKAHATAQQIREHENATLPDMTSFGSEIVAVAGNEVTFQG